MTGKHVYIDFEIILIQQLRLIHAIAESGFPVVIPQSQAYKFDSLRDRFSFDLTTENKEDLMALSEFVTINHKKPLTCIGKIRKPLIFPHAICSHCRTLWTDTRLMKISFVGLATRERRNIIKRWKNEQNRDKNINPFSSALNILKEKFLMKIGNKMSHSKIGQLHVFASRRGRKYPTKAWDEQYYQLMSQSEFVLCPRGKSDWTYRFFEAILCGAIPVVEKDCEVYRGFKFYHIKEQIENFTRSEEIAEYNYKLCLERITIPLPVLNKTLEKMLQ